jgi:hypothetical protein
MKLTLSLRDDETAKEVQTYLDIYDESEGSVSLQAARALNKLLKQLGAVKGGDMGGEELDHNQDETDNIQKSAEPDNDYMDARGLCKKCHGPVGRCGCR